jgi:hypothetical protein
MLVGDDLAGNREVLRQLPLGLKCVDDRRAYLLDHA